MQKDEGTNARMNQTRADCCRVLDASGLVVVVGGSGGRIVRLGLILLLRLIDWWRRVGIVGRVVAGAVGGGGVLLLVRVSRLRVSLSLLRLQRDERLQLALRVVDLLLQRLLRAIGVRRRSGGWRRVRVAARVGAVLRLLPVVVGSAGRSVVRGHRSAWMGMLRGMRRTGSVAQRAVRRRHVAARLPHAVVAAV